METLKMHMAPKMSDFCVILQVSLCKYCNFQDMKLKFGTIIDFDLGYHNIKKN